MTLLGQQKQETNKAANYEIRLEGRLDKDWSNWLEGMVISHDGGVTVLKGHIIDQAALRGILTRIWDLNRTVISVKPILDL